MGRLTHSTTSDRSISHGGDAEGAGEVNEALPIWRAVGDRSGEAATLNSIGLAYRSLGVTQKALDK